MFLIVYHYTYYFSLCDSIPDMGQEEEKTVVISEQFQVESKKRTSYYETTNNTNYIIHSRVREWYKLKSSGRGSTPLS